MIGFLIHIFVNVAITIWDLLYAADESLLNLCGFNLVADQSAAIRIWHKVDEIPAGFHPFLFMDASRSLDDEILLAFYASPNRVKTSDFQFHELLSVRGYWTIEARVQYASSLYKYFALDRAGLRTFRVARLLAPRPYAFFFFDSCDLPRGVVSPYYLDLLTPACDNLLMPRDYIYCRYLDSPFSLSYTIPKNSFDEGCTSRLCPGLRAYCDSRWEQDHAWYVDERAERDASFERSEGSEL